MQNYDAIIIGAGHNGLVTAAYLAKSRKKVLVLERRTVIGGIAVRRKKFFRITSTRPAPIWREHCPIILSLSWTSKNMGWRSYHSIRCSSPRIWKDLPSSSPPRRERSQKKSADFPGLTPENSILFACSLRDYLVSWLR